MRVGGTGKRSLPVPGEMTISAALGVAIREFPLTTGEL